MEIQRRILDIIQRLYCPHTHKLSSASRLNDDLLMDSIDIFECALEVEQEFNITVADADIAELRTVSDIVGLVRKLKERA